MAHRGLQGAATPLCHIMRLTAQERAATSCRRSQVRDPSPWPPTSSAMPLGPTWPVGQQDTGGASSTLHSKYTSRGQGARKSGGWSASGFHQAGCARRPCPTRPADGPSLPPSLPPSVLPPSLPPRTSRSKAKLLAHSSMKMVPRHTKTASTPPLEGCRQGWHAGAAWGQWG